MNARAHAALILTRVIPGAGNTQAQSLSEAIIVEEAKPDFPQDQKALIRELCYGVCRWYSLLDFWISSLLSKPLKKKDRDLYFLLLVGAYQLNKLRIPDHAAISESVNATKALKKNWASKLVNGVLRQFQRQQKELTTDQKLKPWIETSHPEWLYQKLAKNHPDDFDGILSANNNKPPMCLRVNIALTTPQAYLELLHQADITAFADASQPQVIYLERPHNVYDLPGFDEGLVSVQDEAAQWAAILLDLKTDQRVLDACAAPGGKTCHILETCPNIESVTALDISSKRAEKITGSIDRLKLDPEGKKVSIKVGDAQDLEQWWNGESFHRILLDAPCSATGVIRRHPDIKWLRQPTDIKQLAEQQRGLLKSAWQTLEPNGLLLYATCSVLSEENENVIEYFLEQQKDAEELPIQLPIGKKSNFGWQLLPGENQHDGFFYALLRKLPV